MNAPITHPEHSSATQQRCDGCGGVFAPRRRWQRFCKPGCRSAFHTAMSPEALRRDIEDLKRRLAALEAKQA